MSLIHKKDLLGNSRFSKVTVFSIDRGYKIIFSVLSSSEENVFVWLFLASEKQGKN